MPQPDGMTIIPLTLQIEEWRWAMLATMQCVAGDWDESKFRVHGSVDKSFHLGDGSRSHEIACHIAMSILADVIATAKGRLLPQADIEES